MVFKNTLQNTAMYILLFGSYTRFLCSLIKWNLQLAKIRLYPFIIYTNILYPLVQLSYYVMNWLQFQDRENPADRWFRHPPILATPVSHGVGVAVQLFQTNHFGRGKIKLPWKKASLIGLDIDQCWLNNLIRPFRNRRI